MLVHHQLAVRRRRAQIGRRRRTVHALLAAVGVVLSLTLTVVVTGYSGYNGYLSQLPDPTRLSSMEPPEDSHVYAADGTLLATFHEESFRHIHVSLKDVAPIVQRATIDIEDRNFYENSSWDLPRIIKAGYDNITHSGPLQGASTITEQLAKIAFFPNGDRTVDRKIKQLILGNQINAAYSKQQILEMYLNRIPYGNHSIGIETAAQLYFHKRALDLDLAEASMLAGLPESPSVFDPLRHDPAEAVNPAAKARQRTVLDAMVSVGDISEPDADRAYLEPLAFHSWVESERVLDPDFVQYVRSYVRQRWGDAYINPGGWEIVTSLDRQRQAAAETALHEGVAAIRDRFNAHDGAIVSIDPRSGGVQALVGAWDDNDPGVGQLNMALQGVQPGSTIKVFTYSAAIDSRKFTMSTPIIDAPVTLDSGGGPYSPQNYDRKWHGICLLKQCLGNSLNVPAVKVEQATGIPQITDMEIAAGLNSLADPDNRPGPKDYAATLGGLRHGIKPLELASGAATIAALGIYRPPAPVTRISDRVGHLLYAHDPQAGSRRAMPEDVAFIINEMLSNDANRVMEFGPHSDLTLPKRRVSAKTGTTEFFEDNWTVGWVPDTASAVWVGKPQPSCLRGQDRPVLAARLGRYAPLYSGQTLNDPYSPSDLAHYDLPPLNDHCGHLEGATGITGAAPIWNRYMQQALAEDPPAWYPKPADVLSRGPGVGDDADFYLPGTAPAAQPNCIPAGPPTDPTSLCREIPRPEPRPEPQPLPIPIPFPNQPLQPFQPGNGGNFFPPGFGF